MTALTLAKALTEKFGMDHLGDIQAGMAHYQTRLTPAPVGESH